MALDFPPKIPSAGNPTPPNPADGDIWSPVTDPTNRWQFRTGKGWTKILDSAAVSDRNVLVTAQDLVVRRPLTGFVPGHENTILGGGAGETITTSEKCVLIGSNAGAHIGTADNDNIFIGVAAGENASQFSNNNTVIGSKAAALTTKMENCTVLGANTKFKSIGDNNSIIVGESLTGKGSNTVIIGNDKITDTYLQGVVHMDNVIVGGTSGITPPIVKTPESFTIRMGDIENAMLAPNPVPYDAFRFPYAFTLVSVKAYAIESTTAEPTVLDIHDKDDVSILSVNKIQIDVGEDTSLTSILQPILIKTDFAADEEITFYWDSSDVISKVKMVLQGHQT